jgi:hypothetical protein
MVTNAYISSTLGRRLRQGNGELSYLVRPLSEKQNKQTKKHMTLKEKISTFDLINIQNFCSQKDLVKRVKDKL